MNRTPLALLLLALCLGACSNDVEPLSPDDPACDAYDNEEPQSPVAVLIRNDSAAPIYLGSSNPGCNAYIELFLSRDGNDIPFRGDTSCSGTCQDLQQGEIACTDACAIPPLVYIEPGGTYQELWNGTVIESRDMPEGCYGSSPHDSCPIVAVAEPGDYAFTVNVWDDISECSEPAGCSCEPDVNGSCQMFDFTLPSGTPRQATASFSYPGANSVEISVQ